MTKAKLFALSAFAFTMAFAFYRGYQDYENAQETDYLLLANIEAWHKMVKVPQVESTLDILMIQNLVAIRNSKQRLMKMVFLFHGNGLASLRLHIVRIQEMMMIFVMKV